MIIYEYSENVVNNGLAPALLCRENTTRLENWPHDRAKLQRVANADKIYSISGNIAHDLKNRWGKCTEWHISDEEKVVITLKAVLL